MTDSTLNRFLASGTNAQRLAFTPSPPTPASGPSPSYIWHETDGAKDTYAWNYGAAAWELVNTAAANAGQSTSLSQISSSLSGAISSTTSLSTAVSTGLSSTNSTNVTQSTSLSQISSSQSGVISTNVLQSTSLSQISSSLSGAISSTASLSTAVGAGAVWALAGTGQTATGVWDFAVDGAKANVDFAGLAGFNEVLLVTRGVTKVNSALLSAQASVDNGSTFFAASGDYVFLSTAGVEANNAFLADFHATAATAARSGVVHIPMININGVPKITNNITEGTGVSRIFVASNSPINALRVLGQSGGNLTGGKIYCLAR